MVFCDIIYTLQRISTERKSPYQQRAADTMQLPKPLNKYFDHTLLKPEATNEQIDKLCEEAREYDFYSVCVNTCYVSRCYDALKGTDVKVAAVVGFPLGAKHYGESTARFYFSVNGDLDRIIPLRNPQKL